MILSRKLAELMIEKNLSVDEVTETLRSYNLLGLLPSIEKAVRQISVRKSIGDTLMIESPFEVSDDAVQHIKQIVGRPSVPYEITINKSILAGFKARISGTLYDGSAERIIKQFIK